MAGPGFAKCGYLCAQGPIRPLLGDFRLESSRNTVLE